MKIKYILNKIQKSYKVGILKSLITLIMTVSSFLIIFIDRPLTLEFSFKSCILLLCFFIFFIIILYIIISFVVYLKNKKGTFIKINDITLHIKQGNIFDYKSDLKVIPFNEYFDTKVDNSLISSKTLNGKFIIKYYNFNNVKILDTLIKNDSFSKNNICKIDFFRHVGKKVKYKLGTIIPIPKENYLLLAFSHFNKNNQAYLSDIDYCNCILEFWNELNRVYQGKNIVMPLLGSGLTRIKKDKQQLLETAILLLRVSALSFAENCHITILLTKEDYQSLDISKIKLLSD